jgi:riboflavin synthase
MFTGIVTDVGSVVSVEHRGDTRFVIRTGYDIATIDIGASICCDGACLTAVQKGPDWFAVDVSAETLSRTTLGEWRPDRKVNLERSLRVGDELGGHIVTGHVDGVGAVAAMQPEGDSLRVTFAPPRDLLPYIAAKGSVAVSGVSLTVNKVGDAGFGVNLIPHTRDVTCLGQLALGSRVNLEIDILARYVARLAKTGALRGN